MFAGYIIDIGCCLLDVLVHHKKPADQVVGWASVKPPSGKNQLFNRLNFGGTS